MTAVLRPFVLKSQYNILLITVFTAVLRAKILSEELQICTLTVQASLQWGPGHDLDHEDEDDDAKIQAIIQKGPGKLNRFEILGGGRQKAHISFFASTSPAAVVLELPLFKIADTPFAVLSRWAVAGALTGGLCTLSVKDPG